jgi:hypothetical protein
MSLRYTTGIIQTFKKRGKKDATLLSPTKLTCLLAKKLRKEPLTCVPSVRYIKTNSFVRLVRSLLASDQSASSDFQFASRERKRNGFFKGNRN